MSTINKTVLKRRVRFALLCAFAIVLISLIAATIVGVTYADKAQSSEHVLNYETNRLFWNDGVTGVERDGSYQLDLFSSLPVGDDGMKIIAPGAKDVGSMSLVNKTGHSIQYSALIFLVSGDGVPIKADFSNFDPENIDANPILPEDFSDASVLRAVTGELAGHEKCEFIIEWEWAFSTDAESDIFDTELGNLDLSELSVGVFVTVSDNLVPVFPTDESSNINVDTDDDGKPDVNIDTDNDGEAEINVDIDGDFIPDINVDKDGDLLPELYIDIDGDGLADFNFDDNADGTADDSILAFEIKDGIIIFGDKASDMIFDELTDDEPTIRLDHFGPQLTGVQLATDSIKEYSKTDKNLEIDNGKFKIYADSAAIDGITASAKGFSVTITTAELSKDAFSLVQQKSFGEDFFVLGVDFAVKSNTKLLNSAIGGELKVSFSHSVYEGTNIEDYVISNVDIFGKRTDAEFEYTDGNIVFGITDTTMSALLHTKGEFGVITPEGQSCYCSICLFGENCSNCDICWFVVAALVLLLALSITLSLMYSLLRLSKVLIAVAVLLAVAIVILLFI